MSDSPLLINDDQGVRQLTLNRPERLNALNDTLRAQLHLALDEAEAEDDVRVVVITGAGRAFCSGGDVKLQGERAGQDIPSSWYRQNYLRQGARLVARLNSFPKPLVAAVNGAAAGAGMNLALLCDIRLASDSAYLFSPFVDRGLTPDWFGSYALQQHVGLGTAMDILLTGRRVGASEAERLGLVQRVYPSDDFADSVSRYSKKLAQRAPLALSVTKRVLRGWASTHQNIQLELEGLAISYSQGSADHKEALSALAEQRDGEFDGR